MLLDDDGGIKIFGARRWEGSTVMLAGEMLSHRSGVLLGVADGSVLIAEVQAPGRKRMNANDWARGRQDGLGVGKWR
jgi:methionyl-tRNA formyltransferase